MHEVFSYCLTIITILILYSSFGLVLVVSCVGDMCGEGGLSLLLDVGFSLCLIGCLLFVLLLG